MTLTWRHDAHGWVATCGSDGQGIVRVVKHAGGWAWLVDMLPDDQEPTIRSGKVCADAAGAKREAERQVDEWPSLLPGAIRV